jgi:hypothetical protein
MANCGTIIIGTLVSTVRSSAEISNIPFGTLREDRDSEFLSAFWIRLLQLAHTELAFTTAIHSAADGLSERSNQTIIHAQAGTGTYTRRRRGTLYYGERRQTRLQQQEQQWLSGAILSVW